MLYVEERYNFLGEAPAGKDHDLEPAGRGTPMRK